MTNLKMLALAAIALIATASPAFADMVTLDMTPIVNGNWSQQGFAAVPSGNVTLDGVDFAIAVDNGFAGYATTAFSGGAQTLSFSTSIYGATNVYSLLNSFWGTTDRDVHSVTFDATGGLTQTFAINGNDDIRDFLQGNYTRGINGTTTTSVFASGDRRLDMQRFALATGFATQTLTGITFNDVSGSDGYSRLTLTGVTVETTGLAGAVPEPATWAMMIGGIGMVGGAMRRRRASTTIRFA